MSICNKIKVDETTCLLNVLKAEANARDTVDI
jgi:hypothetical protein